jgi:preprotein translocase SecE subunit
MIMAVAVKNMTEAGPQRPINRLAVDSLVGAVYVFAALGVVFYGLPALWWDWLHFTKSALTGAMLILAMVAAMGGLVYLGVRLVGTDPPHGFRAGVFCGLVELLAIGLIACWLGNLIEATSFGESQPAAGLAITLVVGALLCVAAGQFFFRPRFGRWMTQLEDQGWFNAAPYKKTQGQRVRRGTTLGILVLAACGIYTLLAHRALDAGPQHWQVAIPFSNGATWVILPDLRFTVPILLTLGALWIGYRVVNYPVFADFLIATEAELNKVSWTTRKRLIQDTIVVLVTVILLTVFLFLVDQLWARVLTRIGVVQVPSQTEDVDSKKELPW